MELYVDYHSGVPVYAQICQGLREQILSGALEEDYQLPSIRNLAKDLRISVITTKRAYEELEREGLIYTVPGKGCFVARQSEDHRQESHLKDIEDHLRAAVKLARQSGLSIDQLTELLEWMKEEEE